MAIMSCKDKSHLPFGEGCFKCDKIPPRGEMLIISPLLAVKIPALASNTIVTSGLGDAIPNRHTIVAGELGDTIPDHHSVSKLCS